MSAQEQEILDLVLSRLEGVTAKHGWWEALCPAHDDHKPSLDIKRGTEQPVLLTCRSHGCDPRDILAKIGLTIADICAPREREPDGEWTPYGPASAVYDYADEDGKLLYQVCRVPAPPGGRKQFPVRVPDRRQKSGWRWKMNDTRWVLYRLPKLRAAIEAGEIIWVVEGEKDVHAVERAGSVATCNPGGAGNWRPEFAESLRDAIVIIVADADKPGREHAHKVAASLDHIAAAVEIREAAEGNDISDHLASGRTLPETLLTAEVTPEVPSELALDVFTFMEQPDPPQRWVIPGLLERGDRLIWTGFEGLGKTTVIRQVAVGAAAGVHPFDPENLTRRFDPQMVLFIDCENRVARSRRQFRRVMGVCPRYQPVARGMFRVVHRPDGINVLSEEGSAFVLERVNAYKPDLIVIGPLYKLHLTDANEEVAARAVVGALEQAIAVCGSALIVESHCAHGEGYRRPLRPRGSSLLLAWPDFGFGIQPTDPKNPRDRVTVKDWRGAREENDWPRELIRGSASEFPWVVPMSAWREGSARNDWAAQDEGEDS